jgi:hypothetical protein
MLDLLKIQIINTAIRSRHFLKKEHIEKTPHQSIPTQVIPQSHALDGELLLDTADE